MNSSKMSLYDSEILSLMLGVIWGIIVIVIIITIIIIIIIIITYKNQVETHKYINYNSYAMWFLRYNTLRIVCLSLYFSHIGPSMIIPLVVRLFGSPSILLGLQIYGSV